MEIKKNKYNEETNMFSWEIQTRAFLCKIKQKKVLYTHFFLIKIEKNLYTSSLNDFQGVGNYFYVYF